MYLFKQRRNKKSMSMSISHVGVLLVLALVVLTSTTTVASSPTVTEGAALDGLWPMPQSATAFGTECIHLADANTFKFVIDTSSPAADSALLSEALSRYHTLIFDPKRPHRQTQTAADAPPLSNLRNLVLDSLTIHVASPNETLQLGIDESYDLSIDLGVGDADLSSETVFGALYGLETFSQLLVRTPAHGIIINSTSVQIRDFPRFQWRGLMMDTARHFHAVSSIQNMLDAMSYNRLNVLHWHITDSQSFPIKTVAFPKLVEGAYGGAGSTLHYTGDDIKSVVAYAHARGIRVVPEIDSPGHTASWQIGYPDIAVASNRNGIVNPISEKTFAIVQGLFTELASYFTDDFFHIGCDEVDLEALNASQSVVAYMEQHNIPRSEVGFKLVVANYIERLTEIISTLGRTPIAWQEAMDHYGNSKNNPTPPAEGLPNNLVIEQWLNPVWNWANLSAITGDSYASTNDSWPRGHTGFRALSTNGWYLDSTDDFDWQSRYTTEPLTNQSCVYPNITSKGTCDCECPEGNFRDGLCHCYDLRFNNKAQMVLGGEACLWGEHIDASNIQTRAFPRACAVAERLWSDMRLNNATRAAPRLHVHRCRMLERGIDVTPLGPGFC